MQTALDFGAAGAAPARDYRPHEPVIVTWPGGPSEAGTVHWAGDVEARDFAGRPETNYVIAVNLPGRRHPWPAKPEWVRRLARGEASKDV